MSTSLGHVQVILEFGQGGSALPVMRWERSAAADAEAPFVLLGRGFEMAREHSPADISQALAAFLRGAMLDKQDVLDAIEKIEHP